MARSCICIVFIQCCICIVRSTGRESTLSTATDSHNDTNGNASADRDSDSLADKYKHTDHNVNA